MEEVNELVEVADAVRHQFASADDAAKLAAAAAVTSDLEALCASRESDARAVIERLTRVVEAETAAVAPPPEAAAHGERLAAAQARAARAAAAAASNRASAAALKAKAQQAAEQLRDSEADAEADEALDAYEEPRARAALSLFVNISSVAWQMGGCSGGKVVGTFGGSKPSRLPSSYSRQQQHSSSSSSSVSAGAGLQRFEFDEENTPRFDLVNSMWDMLGR